MTPQENHASVIATPASKHNVTLRLETQPKETGRVPIHDLNKTPLPPGFTVQFPSGRDGAVIDSLTPGSSASDKGLAVGDIVHQMNRQPITNNADIERLWNESGKDHVALLVERAGDRPLHMLLPRHASAASRRGNQTEELTRLF